MLYALGITSKISGFNYLKDAVKIVKTDPYGLKSSDVYEAVARIYHTTPSCVERSIQYAKTIAARKGTLPDFLHLIPRRRALPTKHGAHQSSIQNTDSLISNIWVLPITILMAMVYLSISLIYRRNCL